jgi:predicted permease
MNNSFWSDLRVAARRLRKSPGFTLSASSTLALSIAVNLVVFGLLNAGVLKTINVPQADRLFEIEQRAPGFITQSYPDFQDYRTRGSAFTDLAAFRFDKAGVSRGDHATRSWYFEVSGNYFDLLGIQPELGRFFHSSDERGVNSAPYVVLSDAFWRSRFASDPQIIGSAIELNQHPFTVIGVAPPAFHGTELFFWPDFWAPMVNAPELNGFNFLNERYSHTLFVLGRLKQGVSEQKGAADLNSVAAQLSKLFPQTDDHLGVRLVIPGLMGDALGNPARKFLFGVFFFALLVLAAACANLASIFAARSSDRTRELSVRLAIGCRRWHLVRQLLAESVLLSASGTVLGTAISVFLMHAISNWRPIAEYPIHVNVALDAKVYATALVLAIFASILPALLTASQIRGIEAQQAMRGPAAPSFRRMSLRDVLLCLQVAICALLVTSAFVGLRGLQRSLHVPLGFNPENVELAEAHLWMAGYHDAQAFPVEQRMIEEAERIPGVEAAGTINSLPLQGGTSTTSIFREGTTDFRDSNSMAQASFFTISPGYLAASGMSLLSGRNFNSADSHETPRVALINQTLSRTLFGNTPAIGRRFSTAGGESYQVVGVVENGKYRSITEDPKPAIYRPLAQINDNTAVLVVRSARNSAEIARELNTVVARITPNLPVNIESWSEGLDLALFPARVATALLAMMGLLAAILAVTGIFGMASYTVARRLRELGIRVALGAHRLQVLHSALGRTVLLLAGGSLGGLCLGIAASTILAKIVYQATVYDPLVVIGTIASMIAIGVAAAAVPAQRAMRAQPARLLRED